MTFFEEVDISRSGGDEARVFELLQIERNRKCATGIEKTCNIWRPSSILEEKKNSSARDDQNLFDLTFRITSVQPSLFVLIHVTVQINI